MLADAGFVDVSIDVKPQSADIISAWMPGSEAEKYVASAYVTAVLPSSTAPAAAQDNVFAVPPANCCPPPQSVEATDGSAKKKAKPAA